MQNLRHKYLSTTRLTWHRRQDDSFSLPLDSHQLYWSDDRQDQIHGLCSTDPSTASVVTITHSQIVGTADDIKILSEGFFQSVEELPARKIETRNQQITGKQLQLVAKYT